MGWYYWLIVIAVLFLFIRNLTKKNIFREPKKNLKVSENKSFSLLDKYGQCNQENPQGYYVYAHFNKDKPFYIGKGIKRRAWSGKRHLYWRHYVDNYLNGEYQVIILEDNMTDDDAQYLEDKLMRVDSLAGQLVNWINMGRKTDFKKLDYVNQIYASNKVLIKDARKLEKENLDMAIEQYMKAFSNLKDYAFIETDGGLLGDVKTSYAKQNGYSGNINILNRITICLKKSGKRNEAKLFTENYFDLFKADLGLKQSTAIKKRVGLV